MTRVCIAGITGWTAPPIAAAMVEADDLELVAGVARSAAGRSLRDVTGLEVDGQVFGTVAEAVSTGVDVLVDYTSATAVADNVRAAVDAGVHVVIGSSGLSGDQYALIDEAARARGVGVVAAGNFSVMAAILQEAATLAARHLDHWEILDYASDTKPDVPSGTARELAETLADVRRPSVAVPVEQLAGPVEARGADVGGARVHSVRLPGFVATTEIVFAGAGERLVLRHDPQAGADPLRGGRRGGRALRRAAPRFARSFDSWPVPEAEASTWYLGPDGSLRARPSSLRPNQTTPRSYRADPTALPATTYTGSDRASGRRTRPTTGSRSRRARAWAGSRRR